VKVINGDVFDAPELSCICHQVNTFGAMGKGIALTVKEKYPQVFSYYRSYLEDLLEPPYGKVLFCQIDNDRFIANLFSQVGWKTNYNLMDTCLHRLARAKTFDHFAIPYKMGCGLGGGNWSVVSELIEKNLGDRATIYIYGEKIV
jgi:hypothetical protein